MKKTMNILYAIVIIGYIIVSQYFLSILQKNAAATFKPAGYILTSYMIYLIFGAILSVEHIVNNLKKEGPWQINYEKLLAIGLPVLVFSFYVPLFFLFPRLFRPLPFLNQEFSHINFLVLGYVISTCFYKRNSSAHR